MTNASIDILGSLKLNHWYKLAIYLGAVLIILGFVFVNNSNAAEYTSFGVKSLVLGLIVWLLDDTLYAITSWRIEQGYDKIGKAKRGAAVIFAVRWIGLFIWIIIILNSI